MGIQQNLQHPCSVPKAVPFLLKLGKLLLHTRSLHKETYSH